MSKTEFVLDGPTGNPKADRKRAHRKKKHAIINERIAYLRGKYHQTANQRAAEARMYADHVLSLEKHAK
jgi:hypothetical protein